MIAASTPSNAKAVRIADDLAANGAIFAFKPAEGAQPPSFNYSLPKGGDRWKCRGLVAEAKADPAIWRALVHEIETRCRGAA